MKYIFIRTAKPKYKFWMMLMQIIHKNKYKGLQIGKFCKIDTISYIANLLIGDNSEIHNCNFQTFNKINKYTYLHQVQMDDYSYIGSNSSIINTTIGKFCSIADGVKIGGGMHPTHTFVSTHPAFFSTHKQCGTTFADISYFNETGHTSIGNDVWIGANAIIMDNITIGDGAIIGAGAVVTKNIPPFSIALGVPAKVIKYRFNAQEIDFLVQLQWWNKPVGWLKKNFKYFHNIQNFKNLI